MGMKLNILLFSLCVAASPLEMLQSNFNCGLSALTSYLSICKDKFFDLKQKAHELKDTVIDHAKRRIEQYQQDNTPREADQDEFNAEERLKELIRQLTENLQENRKALEDSPEYDAEREEIEKYSSSEDEKDDAEASSR